VKKKKRVDESQHYITFFLQILATQHKLSMNHPFVSSMEWLCVWLLRAKQGHTIRNGSLLIQD